MAHLMIDRDRPPTASELQLLKRKGVEVVAGYVGGPNRHPQYWTQADYQACQAAGFTCWPIYVGQNVCPGCWPAQLDYAQGHVEGQEAVQNARDFGFQDGLLILDVEYDTYWQGGAAPCNDYASGWARVVSDAGYLPVVYGPTGMWTTWDPGVPAGYWVANWDGIGDLSKFPDPKRFQTIGWQWGDQWYGFDVSYVDDRWVEDAPVAIEQVQGFETGFTIQGGIAQAWQHNGGLVALGEPTSQEYDTSDAAGPVRRQWFQRAVAEWREGQWPDNWDVEWMLLADIIRDDPGKLEELRQDVAAHPDAFRR